MTRNRLVLGVVVASWLWHLSLTGNIRAGRPLPAKASDSDAGRHSGIFALASSLVSKSPLFVGKRRRSSDGLGHGTTTAVNDSSLGFEVTADRAARIKLAKIQRGQQLNDFFFPGNLDFSVRKSEEEKSAEQIYHSLDDPGHRKLDQVDQSPAVFDRGRVETNPEIRNHGKPPFSSLPGGARQDRQRPEDSDSQSFFSRNKETPPHLQHFHEHLLNLIQSVPASSRTSGDDPSGNPKAKTGTIRFPSAPSTSHDDDSHSTHENTNEKRKKKKRKKKKTHRKPQMGTKKVSISSVFAGSDDDELYNSAESNAASDDGDAVGTPPVSSYYPGTSQQNTISVGSNGYPASYPTAPHGVISDINIQVDVEPAVHHGSHLDNDADDDDDDHNDHSDHNDHDDHNGADHDVVDRPVYVNSDDADKGSSLSHSSIGGGSVGVSHSGSGDGGAVVAAGVAVDGGVGGVGSIGDVGSLLNIPPSSSHSSHGPGPEKGPIFSKKAKQHGIYFSNRLYENVLSGIAVAAFLTFLANQLVQGLLVGGRRRRRKRSAVRDYHEYSVGNLVSGLHDDSLSFPSSVIFRLINDQVHGHNEWQSIETLSRNVSGLLDDFGLRDL